MPAGLATIRDRSFRGDPDRKLAWMLVISTIPAAIVGRPPQRRLLESTRSGRPGSSPSRSSSGPGSCGSPTAGDARTKGIEDVGPGIAFGLGAAQALALIPGVSRSGISVSAALFAGLRRVDAVRYSFLMATPITAAAVAYEGLKLIRGDVTRARRRAS